MKIIIVLLAVLCTSCTFFEEEKVAINNPDILWINLSKEVNQLIIAFDSLEKKGKEVRVIKTITSLDKKENQSQSISDWKKELLFFSESNIDKPVLYGAYKIVQNDGVTTYQSIDERNKVKLIRVIENKGRKNITIRFVDQNIIYSIDRFLEMKIDKGILVAYEIKGKKKILGTDEVKYQILAKINIQ